MATGVTGLVGHGLASFTTEISVIRLSFPGLDLCFVDTPGFDATDKSDVDIFKLISNWLYSTWVSQMSSPCNYVLIQRSATNERSDLLACYISIGYLIIGWQEHR